VTAVFAAATRSIVIATMLLVMAAIMGADVRL